MNDKIAKEHFETSLRIAKENIKEKIIDPKPPEQEVAIILFLYGITEVEFSKMKGKLDISEPIFVKIQNYLREEWKNII